MSRTTFARDRLFPAEEGSVRARSTPTTVSTVYPYTPTSWTCRDAAGALFF